MKTFSKIEIATIKRQAQNVAQFTTKKEKLDKKIAELQAEKDALQPIIDSFNIPIKEMTGGYTTEDLVTREVVHTGKMDEKGKEILQTRFVLKYPETVIPPLKDTKENYAETASEEMPEELVAEQAQAQQEAESADPFAGTDGFDGWN